MKGLRRLMLPAVAATVMVAATGCFTGIESTPRITADDVRHAGIRTTDEQALNAALVAPAPAAWHPGKQWLVDDSKIALIFTSPAPGAADSLAGSTLTLAAVDTVRALTGIDEISLALATPAGAVLNYRPGIPADQWTSRAALAIPFTIELETVARADSLLRGRTFYITTPDWFDAAGHSVTGRRHVPVRVSGVGPGTERYPLRVAFTATDRPDSATYSVFLTCGNSPAATRNFDRLFSFTDPRTRYPRITDETWALIVRSQVVPGMTRDECRLALGTPASIDRRAGTAAQYEMWTYDTGVYLIFEDGVLTQFRK